MQFKLSVPEEMLTLRNPAYETSVVMFLQDVSQPKVNTMADVSKSQIVMLPALIPIFSGISSDF